MGITMRFMAICAMLLAGLAGPQAGAAEGGYPSKPIRLVVPYPPGGTTDILARILGARLGPALGQSVVVENRGGANGNIGSQAVAQAAPDGYTLLMGSAGPLTVNPVLYASMPFDAQKDFAPISLFGKVPLVLVANPSLGVTSYAGLVDYAKRHPGKLTFASSGNGSMQHVAGELLKQRAGIDMRHIPYRGAGPALVDLLGGRVDIMIDLLPSSMPHIAAGELRPLAVATARRLEALPKVPTLAESGLEGFDVSSWFGILAPAGTPKAIVDRLHAEIAKAVADPAVGKQFAEQGVEPAGDTPAEFAAYIQEEISKWGPAMKAAHARIE